MDPGPSSTSKEVEEAKLNTTTEPETRGQKRKRTDSSESKVELKIMDKELTAPEKAMNNALIMSKIAENLPLSCLASLRQTCTMWNRSFLPQLRKNHSQIWLNCSQQDVTSVGFMDMIRSTPTSDIPFSWYYFDLNNRKEDSASTDAHARDLDSFLEFIQTYGRTVMNLELYCRRHADLPPNQLREIIFDKTPELTHLTIELEGIGPIPTSTSAVLLKTLPKLKRLKVTVANEPSATVNPAFEQFVCDVIQSAEGLEKLSLDDGRNRSSDDEYQYLETVLKKLFDIQHINKLKILKLPLVLSSVEFTVLTQLGGSGRNELLIQPKSILNLTSFSTNLRYSGIPDTAAEAQGVQDYQLLYNFLVTQSSTLKKLTIYFEGDGDFEDETGFHVVFPRMEHLDKLKIQRSTLQEYEIQFTDNETGQFVDAFPQLTRFCYQYDPEADNELFFLQDVDVDRVSHPRVTSFSYQSDVQECVNFCHFGPVYPSLTRLELKLYAGGRHLDTHIDVKEFASVWTTWPNLTAVRLTWHGHGLVDLDLDAFISGVPRLRLEIMRQELDLAVTPTAASLRTMLDKFKIRAGIVDMKHLRELKIIFLDSGDYSYPQLTDLGAYFGLSLASPTLQKIFIAGHGKNLLSEQCLTYIRSVFGPLAPIEL